MSVVFIPFATNLHDFETQMKIRCFLWTQAIWCVVLFGLHYSIVTTQLRCSMQTKNVLVMLVCPRVVRVVNSFVPKASPHSLCFRYLFAHKNKRTNSTNNALSATEFQLQYIRETVILNTTRSITVFWCLSLVDKHSNIVNQYFYTQLTELFLFDSPLKLDSLKVKHWTGRILWASSEWNGLAK